MKKTVSRLLHNGPNSQNFKNIKNQVEAPFVVYADFESILKNLSNGNKCKEHIGCSYAYHIVSNIPGVEFDLHRPYVGLDAIEKILDSLKDDLNRYIMPITERDVDMVWNEEAKENFRSETH